MCNEPACGINLFSRCTVALANLYFPTLETLYAFMYMRINEKWLKTRKICAFLALQLFAS